MDLQNLLLKLNINVLRSMSHAHHVIVVGLIAYLIRYCAGSCYKQDGSPLTCITSPINAASKQEITASNTCGNPPEVFCYIGPQRTCEVCSQNEPALSHPAKNMVDQFSLTNITWWKSQTWWTSNQLGLSKMFQPLKVNVTLLLKKRYLISGGVYVTFRTERPKQMIIERSNDFGKTWRVYQYYAKNCRSAYNLQADPSVSPSNSFNAICSELYSGEFPRVGGIVHFDPRTRYQPADYFNAGVHNYLEATAIRIRLEYPGTDGREYINEETTLNQYFYAISDLRVDARCDCNGHGEFCDIKKGKKVCDCKHFTTGVDCEQCLPMYSNREWRAGNLTDANPCEKCQCFDHADTCTYNSFLKQGICNNCRDNTTGIRCHQCVDKFYRNISTPLNHANACILCDCYQPGITDNGKCSESTTQLGQCNCKIGIYGRRCDQCIPGKWGFVNLPVGSCFDCGCNMYGTLNNDQVCDPYTGQCKCKPHTTGRACDKCKVGYYRFPTTFQGDCISCPCNAGGGLTACDPNTGACTCKTGVTGSICDRVQPGYFFPNFTHVKYEPEFSSANGTFTWHFLVRNYAKFFTGLGFARLDAGQKIMFTFTVPTTAKYFMLLRYSLYHLDWYSSILPQGRELVDWSGSTNMQFYLKRNDRPSQWSFSLQITDNVPRLVKAESFSMADLLLGDDRSWSSTSFVELAASTKYTFTLVYQATSNQYGQPWPLLLDSFILMLDYNWATYYSELSGVAMKNEIKGCFQSSRALSTTYNLPAYCGPHTFTVDTQLYDRVLACNCFQPGSFVWNTCATYGGQCQCKMGYGDRRCSQCIPGYYGNPTTGCTGCGCSVFGSLSNACNHVTGQCLCKANAHGLKCSGCLHGFFHLSEKNPRGCQSCFGYGHLSSCTVAVGFVRSYVSSHLIGALSFDGWKLFSPLGKDRTNLLLKTSLGMEYTDERNEKFYLSAPVKFLGDQLYSYGQHLIVQMHLFPVVEKLASSVPWHIKLRGNNQIAMFRFLEEISKTRTRYTVVLHQNYMLNGTKLSEFNFKAMLGQLEALHICLVYYESPVTVTVKSVNLESARYMPSNTNMSVVLRYIEHAKCLQGYKGLSCESCDVGYTRVIPNGGPLINCVPCACNGRSKTCDPQSGVCSNCQPGSMGSYCEKCLPNVQEPNCDRCVAGYWGLYNQVNGCKPCNCYLPGTEGGSQTTCDRFSGKCVCNQTINVGGRQCNICKENSYNISLGDELRCQECPVCYGLIEDSVLLVRKDIFIIQVEIINVVSKLSASQITPFFQAISSIQSSLTNLTINANIGKITVSGLDFLWKTLEDRLIVFIGTLQGSVTIKMNTLLTEANAIFNIHNATAYQYYNIYHLVTNSYNLVNNTVRARMLQQMVALNQLNKLANEMSSYVTQATTYSNNVLTKKYDLKQKIQLSIKAATQAANMASQTRKKAFNLTITLTPVYTRAIEVKGYADECIVSIQSWLTDAIKTLAYAQNILSSVAIKIPDHSVNITTLKTVTTTLSNQYQGYTSKLFTLSNDINAIALEITKLKTTLLETQISSVGRRSSLYSTNLFVLKNKTNLAISDALLIRKEATSIYNIIRNFVVVASQAQNAANTALQKVATVKSSVELASSTAVSISNQIQGPKSTAATALQVMSTAHQITIEEKKIVDSIHQTAVNLYNQTQSAQVLIQGDEIRIYIQTKLTPLVTQCASYRTLTTTAYASAQSAHSKASQANLSAVQTTSLIRTLANNIQNLETINSSELQSLLTSVQTLRTKFLSLNLSNDIQALRVKFTNQVGKINNYRTQNLNLIARINAYKLIYQSLTLMKC